MSQNFLEYNPEGTRNIDALWIIYIQNSLSAKGISWRKFLKFNLASVR